MLAIKNVAWSRPSSNGQPYSTNPFPNRQVFPPVQYDIDRQSKSACQLSIVIPAFNEANRLPVFLESVRRYMQNQFCDDYEVVVVDDGSTDQQQERVHAMSVGWQQLRYLKHDCNYGKGAAVRTGMLNVTGEIHLFADADGATPIQEEIRLRERIFSGADCCVGSRRIESSTLVRRRSFSRQFSGRVFSCLTHAITGVSVIDTQCGFKMFRAAASRKLFQLCAETGYIFDVEILGIAERLGMRVDEVGVNWSEIPGSKVRLFQDSIKMVADMLRVRRELDRILI